MGRLRRIHAALAALALLAACSRGPATLPASTPLSVTATPRVVEPATVTPAPTVTPTVAVTATATASPTPTATLAPTATIAPTATTIPTATATPYPLSIAAMRARDYPGSEITIEETLAPGANYSRYIASYLSDGLKIQALLTVPSGERPESGWPVVVFNHGYIPPNVYRTTERYIAYVDAIARDGYIVFRPDYRGNGFSEGEASGAYGYPDYTVDVLNAVASVKQYAEADPARIGMWGHSMGGFLTLRSMVIRQDVKAGVIWAGVVSDYADMFAWFASRPPVATPTPGRRWRQEMIDRFGTPADNPEFWSSLAANSYLADLSGPLQLHHGTADTEVPLAFSQRLAEQVKAVGGVVELYEYEGDNHNLSGSFGLAMARTLEFFDRYLKGE